MERQLVHTDNLEKESLQEMTPDEDRLVQTRKKKGGGTPRKQVMKTSSGQIIRQFSKSHNVLGFYRVIWEVYSSVENIEKVSDTSLDEHTKEY